MRSAIVDRLLRVVKFQEAELQTAGEAVAATDAVENFQFRILAAFKKLSVMPQDGAPVIFRGRDHATQCRRRYLEVRVRLYRGFNHRLERIRLNRAQVVVGAFDFEAE